MLGKRTRFWVVVGATMLISAALGAAQDTKKPDTKKTPAAQSQKKPILVDATRVSTDAAAQSVAKEATKKTTATKDSKDSNDSAVLEFKPASPDAANSSGDVVQPKDSKKKRLKNVHGEVFGTKGAQAAGTQGAGAAVGATSKSGKTSVYVETERQRTTPPR